MRRTFFVADRSGCDGFQFAGQLQGLGCFGVELRYVAGARRWPWNMGVGEWTGDNPLAKVRALKFDEAEMAYLSAEQIQDLLSALAAEKADAALIAEVCLATGARWGEAEALQPRQVRNWLIHYSKTKSSKNRTVPISADLQARLDKALPFRPGYNLFRKVVEKIGLELPDGQLTHVLRHATLAMTQKCAHFSPGHLADVVNLNPLAGVKTSTS